MPPNIRTSTLSHDAKYLREMSMAVSTGVCPPDLANKKAGPLHNDRWLTRASRILREYVSNDAPSKNMTVMVKYIQQVYVPMHFNIRHRSSCAYGSVHFFNLIKATRYLEQKYRNAIDETCKNNPYFAHPENIQLAMIFDENVDIRKMGYAKILQARRHELDFEFGEVREYEPQRAINFNCQHYYDLIDWEKIKFTEPPFTLNMAYDDIEKLLETGDVIQDDFTNVPCHTQATERGVKATSEMATVAATHEGREGAMAAAQASRAKKLRFD